MVTKYTIIILQAATEYANKDYTNAGQTFDVKVPGKTKSSKLLTKITLIDSTATVYRDFQYQLSVKANGVEFNGQT